MSWRLEIRELAFKDISEAGSWYEERQPGLGERFVDEVATAIDGLQANPMVHRLRHRQLGARWCFPRHFPYRIVFRAYDNVISVVAVIHAARSDRHWKQRF